MIPKPDLAAGMPISRHTEPLLNSASFPCLLSVSQIDFPVLFKGLESIPYSVLQSHLNAAHMLQNLYTLRSHAGGPDWEAQLYGGITVIIVSLLKDKIGIYGHWVGQGHKYHSCALKTSSTEYGDYAGIRYSCRIFAVREKGQNI